MTHTRSAENAETCSASRGSRLSSPLRVRAGGGLRRQRREMAWEPLRPGTEEQTDSDTFPHQELCV